jgi:hypothetical protein
MGVTAEFAQYRALRCCPQNGLQIYGRFLIFDSSEEIVGRFGLGQLAK